MLRLLLVLVAVALSFGTAAAQDRANVVANCGTPNHPYNAGTNQPTTQNTGGSTCVNATVSASVSVAPLTSTNLSGTIATTNTFQSIQVSTAGRKGCAVQNNGSHNMDVFFGAIGSATTGNSFVLSPGQGITCAVGGLAVLTDQVSVTGTSGDAYAANFQ